jgi:predicted permease
MTHLDAVWRDLRYAVRVLLKSPVFTVTSVGTLALCIGANTAIYTVVDRVLLRPLPYPEPDRLAQIVTHFQDQTGSGGAGQTGSTWEVLRDGVASLDVAATAGGFGSGVNMVAHGQAEYVKQQRVSAGFFHVLGVMPALGREFTVEEDRPNGPAAAVLSDALWRRIFGADPGIVGRALTLRGEPYTIVGVMPASFRGSAPADVWTPARPWRRGEGGGQNYGIIARLKPGVSWAQADADVAAVGDRVMRDLYREARVTPRLHVVPLQRSLTEDTRRPLFILWAAVGVVLLIGCVNIAGLFLARSARRAPEIATRIALGGGRAAIVRQLLAESLVLAAAGGATGIALGYLGIQAFASLLAAAFGVTKDIDVDVRVLAVTAAVSLLTSIAFGLFPALQASRVDLRAAMGITTVAGTAHGWPRRVMVLAQVAMGVMLLVGAGLLLRTFDHLMRLRAGFDSTNVMSATLSLQDARYATAERVNRLFDRTLERFHALPRVQTAAVCLTLPYERALNVGGRWVGAKSPDDLVPILNMTYVTPEYFETLRIPVVRGRVFAPADNSSGAPVIVLNEAFVRRYSRDQDPIGRQLAQGGTPRTVVGIVGDIQQKAGWGNFGPVAAVPAAYVPAAQFSDAAFKMVHTWFSPSWVVRTAGPQAGIAAEMQRAVQSVDPQLPFAKFRTLDDVRGEAVVTQRAQATLLGSLAVLALLLAAVGIYGLVANSVMERTRELSIRMALGATPRQTLQAAALPGVALGLAGVLIGVACARAGSRVMQALVWNVSVGDPLTFGLAAATVLLVAVAAALVPSLRILRLNPVRALRQA